MSKKNEGAAEKLETKTAGQIAPAFAMQRPDGVRVGAEIQGIVDYERTINGQYVPFQAKVLEARAFDGKFGASGLWVLETTAVTAILDDDNPNATLPAGSIVGIWSTGKLKRLATLANAEVWIQYKGKRNLKGGQTLHDFEIVQLSDASGKVTVVDMRERGDADESGYADLPF